MKNRVFCSAFGISADEKKIWGSAYDFNEIYQIDLLDDSMKSLGQLEDEDNIFNLVESIECVKDKILFIPGSNGRYFHILDIKTGEQINFNKNIFFNEQAEPHINSFFSFVWEDTFYVVCRDQLVVYYYDLYKCSFKTAFHYNEQNLFHCRSFSVCEDTVAFLSIELNKILIYNLRENRMQQIDLDKKMTGVNRIAITDDRIALYRVEDKKIFLMDKRGVLIKEFMILSESGNRIMAFTTKEHIYLLGITNWIKEVFQIDKNGDVVNLNLSNMHNLDAYCLNRVKDNLYLYEFTTCGKKVASLNYNAQKCYKYRLGANAVEAVGWATDGIEYERQLADMLKQGNVLAENSGFDLEFLIENINADDHQGVINRENTTIGLEIYNRC